MNEEIKKSTTVKKGKNGNQKNVSKTCGKKIFDKDMQTTMCIKTRYGGEICLNCAYEIEETLSRAEFSGMMDYDDFFDMKKYAGEGNIGHMLEWIKYDINK